MFHVLFKGSNSELYSRGFQKFCNAPTLPIASHFPFEPFILAASAVPTCIWNSSTGPLLGVLDKTLYLTM